MKIVVTDACIFIDLLELGISSNFFQLELEVHTTYEVWDELFEEQQETLKAYHLVGKLTIHVLEQQDFVELAKLNFPRALSPPDQTVLFMAEKLDAILLSSDGKVRKYAKKRSVDTHGLFWIIDELVAKELLTKPEACSMLYQLFKDNLMYKNNNKLWKEAETRIKLWK